MTESGSGVHRGSARYPVIIPAKMSQITRQALLRAGVVFGGRAGGMLQYIQVRLPDGWERAVDPATGQRVLRDRWGYTRAQEGARYGIPYITATTRFYIMPPTQFDRDRGQYIVRVADRGYLEDGQPKVMFQSTPYRIEPGNRKFNEQQLMRAIVEAQTWIQGHFPEWLDPEAHWPNP